MKHAELREALAVYRDLRGAEREEVDRHLAGCAECSALLGAYRVMDRNLSAIRDARPDSRLQQRFYAAIDEKGAATRMRPAHAVRPRVRPVALAAAAVVILIVVSAAALWQSGWPGGASIIRRLAGGGVSAPHSALVGSFVWQTDGAYGYQMLRPAGWEAADLDDLRAYTAPAASDEATGLRLGVVNYEARYGGARRDSGGAVSQLAAFEQNPTLAGWSAAMEQSWRSDGGQLQLLRSLPDANIYTLTLPDAGSLLVLLGFKVEGGQPLGITLMAGGSYADMTWVQSEGMLDDFVTMVASTRAIPFDPRNIAPALPPALPSAATAIHATPTPVPTGTPSPTAQAPEGTPTEVAIGQGAQTLQDQQNFQGAQVTLDVFSGRPDPSWSLAADEAQKLRAMLEALPEVACRPMDLQLGYRGFVVLLGQPPELSNEYRLRVYDGQVRWGDPWNSDVPGASCRSDAGRQVERFLLESGRGQVAEDIYAPVEADLGKSPPTANP